MDEVRKSNEAFLHDETVTVALDNCSQPYLLSKALLCSASKYFSAALTGHFREATDRALRLPGCDEEVFQLFIYYFTHDHSLPELALKDKGSLLPKLDPQSPASQRVILAIRLWKFADACLMPKLQNEAMRLVLSQLSSVRVNHSIVEAAFEGTGTDAPIRKAIVDKAVGDWRRSAHKEVEAYEAMMNEAVSIRGFFFRFCRKQANMSRGLEGLYPEGDQSEWYKVDEM